MDRSTLWSDIILNWADRYRWWLLGLVAAFFLVGFNGQWRIEADSALYLSIARNLATGQGYTYHGLPNAVAYPGLPYLMAGLFRLMPAYHRKPENLFPENGVVFLCALGTLALTYRLIRFNAGRPTAVLVTCGVGVTRTFYRYSFALMTDVPFLFGAMAILTGFEGLLAAEKNPARRGKVHWLDGGLLLAGVLICVVMRPAWLALVPAVAIALILSNLTKKISWKDAAIGLGLAGMIAGTFFATDPRQAAGKFRLDRYEDQFFHDLGSEPIGANARQIIEETAASASFGLKFMTLPASGETWHWYTYLGVAGNVIAGAMILIGGLGLFARRGLWGMWIVATIVMMLLVLPHERYFLQVMPLLIFGWWRVICWINRKIAGPAGNVIFGLLLLWGILPNAALCGHIIIEQRGVPFFHYYKEGRCQPLIDVAQRMRVVVPQNAIVLAPEKMGRIMTYLSRRTVCEPMDLRYEGKWPPTGRSIYVADVGEDEGFTQWLASLGISATEPVPGGPPNLRQVTRTTR